MAGESASMMTPAIPTPALEIIASAARVRAVLMELPRESPGAKRAIAKIDSAMQRAERLLRGYNAISGRRRRDRVGDWPAGFRDGLRQVAEDLRTGYQYAKRTAYALLNLPYRAIEETYRTFRDWSNLPEAAVRELGQRLGTAVDHGLEVLDRNMPLLLALAEQVYTGIGVGLLVAVVAGMLILFPPNRR